MKKAKKTTLPLAETALKRHFARQPLQDLITASRTFPITARVDVQLALDKMFADHPKAKLLGVHTQYQHETLTIAHLLGNQHFPVVIGPLQNEEIDIGETLPARCLRQGLWLVQDGDVPVALLLSPAFRFGHPEGTHIEIAVPPGESGSERTRRLFDELEALVRQTASYRGKVISLESPDAIPAPRPITRSQTPQCAAGRSDPAREDPGSGRSSIAPCVCLLTPRRVAWCTVKKNAF